MQLVAMEVKSKDVLLSTIDVPVFETIQEAVEQLTEEACLKLINRQHKADLVNTERSSKTRPTSTEYKIAKAIKGKTKEELEALAPLLESLGLTQEELEKLNL